MFIKESKKYLIYFFLTVLFAGNFICYPVFSQFIKKENLGRDINTKYSEHWPVISPDGRTLYFLREGHPDNLSESGDIWFSNLQTDGTWSLARHMGKPLNTIAVALFVPLHPMEIHYYCLECTGQTEELITMDFLYPIRPKKGGAFREGLLLKIFITQIIAGLDIYPMTGKNFLWEFKERIHMVSVIYM
ncbi:MAG: hypothetical protein WC358_02790 [Ignavibacteria bacterium]|jgi:hypothetical protein